MENKKIIIEIEVPSTSDNERIKNYISVWVKENFQNYKEAKIKVEDING